MDEQEKMRLKRIYSEMPDKELLEMLSVGDKEKEQYEEGVYELVKAEASRRNFTLEPEQDEEIEMAEAKQKYNDYGEVPYYRKQWFFWLMWFLFSPVAIGLLLTGEVYYKKKGEVKAFGMANRIVAGIIALMWLINIFNTLISS